MASGGDLQVEITNGKHSSSSSHTEVIRANIVQDVVNGSVLMFKRPSVSDIRGLRVSPLGAVEVRNLHIIYGLTFA